MKSPRRRSVLGLLGVSAAVAIALPIYTMAIGASPQAPDLRADPVENIDQPAVATSGLGTGRLLVRFDGFVTNVGEGPLEVSGNPNPGPGDSPMQQYARMTTGGPVNVPEGAVQVKYEAADGHHHFHLMHVMRYSLWNSARTAEVAPGQKVGFCLYDLQQASNAPVRDNMTYTDAVTHFCRDPNYYNPNNPDAEATTAQYIRMGTSPGWRDVYDKSLSYQWVDVSDTPPGVYYVASDADPDNVVWEGGGGREINSRAFASNDPVTVPGWIAQPVSTPQTGAAKSITLATTKFGGQGNSNLRFKVISGPTHGSLNVATGAAFAAGSVTYTPAPGYTGADGFTYAALNASSSFPLSPVVATASLTSTAPSVAISGAPGSMYAGTSVQLSPTLANLTGGVTWSTTAGTVTPDGLFTAPGTPGSATVTVTSAANPNVRASITIAIAPVPPQTALPSVTTKTTKPLRRALLSRVATGHVGKRLIVGKVSTGRKHGRVTFTATVKRKVLGRCSARVPAQHSFSCKIVLKRNYPLTKVLMTAKLKFGKKSVVKRAYVVKRRR